MKYTTRTQLKGYGLSDYQATAITKNLTPTGKEGRCNTYSLPDAIASIRERKESRIKPNTREVLTTVLAQLMQRLDNVTAASFSPTTDSELSRLAKKAFLANQKVDAHYAELKATAATYEGKNGRKPKQKVIHAQFGS